VRKTQVNPDAAYSKKSCSQKTSEANNGSHTEMLLQNIDRRDLEGQGNFTSATSIETLWHETYSYANGCAQT
jgi:hypothetical protein